VFVNHLSNSERSSGVDHAQFDHFVPILIPFLTRSRVLTLDAFLPEVEIIV